METIFMNTENRFRLTLADRLNLKDRCKKMALANVSIYYTQKNIKFAYSNKFDLPNGSYSILDIQDYFEFIIKKHETLTEIFTFTNLHQ